MIISLPKQLAEITEDNKQLATCPFITATSDNFPLGSGSKGTMGAYTTFQNIFGPLIFMFGMDTEPTNAISKLFNPLSQPKLALSKDKKFCYIHGVSTFSTDLAWNFANKINIAENTIVWGLVNPGEDPNTPTACAVDNNGNLLISNYPNGNITNSTYILNADNGAILESSPLRAVNRFAVASDGFIYASVGLVHNLDLNIYKLNPDLTVELEKNPQEEADPSKDNANMSDCVLNHDETVLFVVGQNYTTEPALWAIDPDNFSVLGTSTILGLQGSNPTRMILMPDGSLVILANDPDNSNEKILRRVTYSNGTFTEVTTGVWPIESGTNTWRDVFLGPLNYIFISFAGIANGIRAYTQHGVFITSKTVTQTPFDVAFLPTQSSIYMNQTMEPENKPDDPADSSDFTEIRSPDMCSFLSDEIPRHDITVEYAVDDIFYFEGIDNQSYYNNLQVIGIFKAVEILNIGDEFFENFHKMERISKTLPTQNADWDQYTGIGGHGGGGLVVGGVQTGIGNSPQFYTISFFGLLIADDGGVSPYNGNFVLRRIPGMWGAFAAFDPATRLQINFNINSVEMPSLGISGSDTFPTKIFTKIRAYRIPEVVQYAIVEISENEVGDDEIVVVGNHTSVFVTDTLIEVRGAEHENHNGQHTVLDSVYEGGPDQTVISVELGDTNQDGGAEGTVEVVNVAVEMIFQADVTNSNWEDEPTFPPDFAYSEDASPSNIANELLDEVPNIAYTGTCSLYPGRREEWDANTQFADEVIVVHDGKVFQAQQENTGQEPDITGSDTTYWLIITGPA